jgi:hypothetical protein
MKSILDVPMREEMVTNPKGTQAETAVVRYLQEHGFPYAERRAKTGRYDCGDINVDPSVVIEVKNHKAMDLAGWIDQTEVERENGSDALVAVCWHKRPRRGSPGDWYVTMTGAQFAYLLREHCE